MPANRSRTERWMDCLREISERGGSIELAIARQSSSGAIEDAHSDLVWRVRLFAVNETEMIAENPSTLNTPARIPAGTALIAAMTIGQNRWMFRTTALGPAPSLSRGPQAIRLRTPDHVERCSRRSFYRVPLGGIELPSVELWPLLDPASVVVAEVANRAHIHDLQAAHNAHPVNADAVVLPEVGPRFGGVLANLGGGGAGILIERAEAGPLDHHRLFWMRIDLRPEIEAPIGLTAKLAHTHADSGGRVYAGVAFEFGFNQGHRDFVVEQIGRYISRRLPAGSRTSLAA